MILVATELQHTLLVCMQLFNTEPCFLKQGGETPNAQIVEHGKNIARSTQTTKSHVGRTRSYKLQKEQCI